jgi:hypothetical protein
MEMSLFKMWENAFKIGKLPDEWEKWDSFRSWAIKNNYKAEYGYKGEFTPEGCLKAMPEYVEESSNATVANLFNIPEEILSKSSNEYAAWLDKNGTVESLKKFAADSNINLGKVKTKKEIIEIIIKAGE